MSEESDYIDRLVVKKLLMTPGARVIYRQGLVERRGMTNRRGTVVNSPLNNSANMRWCVRVRWDGRRRNETVDLESIELLPLVERIGELEDKHEAR